MRRTAVLVALVGVAQSAQAENVVGRWCDPGGTAPSVIEIVHLDSDAFEARITGADGAALTRPLDGPYEYSFPVTGTTRHEAYVVHDATGDLELIDTTGLIRSARRMADMAAPETCLNGG
jgi:hypothetical protein